MTPAPHRRARRVVDARDVLALAGRAFTAAGAALVYLPAGLLVVGVALLAAGVVPQIPRAKRPR